MIAAVIVLAVALVIVVGLYAHSADATAKANRSREDELLRALLAKDLTEFDRPDRIRTEAQTSAMLRLLEDDQHQPDVME